VRASITRPSFNWAEGEDPVVAVQAEEVELQFDQAASDRLALPCGRESESP